ncbi:LuxE family acyl-protein synthetase [Brenneria rubrifaciens]|uniref:LuxE family acyl-protein synthetase n=1 Tax=Brenneria rubrifaciens TaxID=55213 RepID=A0A4P8QSN5_9GAMM|nr:LuxE family acyl-protein synthetase [Brenneria rubrifaciens]QCR08370.1 LuxE family acyl-protein synthetase [Brenneria rubrifaciens]
MDNLVNIYNGIKLLGGSPLKWLISDVDALYRLSIEEQKILKTLLIKEAFSFHYNNNHYYRKLCDEQGVSLSDINEFDDLVRIPLIPISVYKSTDNFKLLSIPLNEVEHEMFSTGTSGIPSINRRCHETMNNTVLTVYTNYRSMFKISSGAGLCLCPSPEDAPEMALVKIFNFLTGLLDTRYYAVQRNEFDCDNVLEQLAGWQNNFTRHIMGPPFMVHRFISHLKKRNIKLELDKDSLIIMMGGWKRFSGEMISRSELNQDITNWLGIPPEHIRDMYGMAEANVLAIEDEYHHKHVPPYIHFSVRNPEDITQEVPDGEIGQLAVLDPLAISVPALLLTEDLVYLRTDKCKSWRNSQRVEFVSRTSAAKEFGCCAVNLERKLANNDERENL